ncbi:MAG: transposase [Desulfobacterales bacterium]|nr:transposase [Desulfobacterales bacterium]
MLSRGNNRQDIFEADDDRTLFLELIGEFSNRFNIELYAYVLMNNHYHLLIKTIENNLSKSMQWLGTTYTRKFNIKNDRGGHLFQGRFKSIIIENDAYLLQLSCYIHRNPLRAGIVGRLVDYNWSSYRFYAYRKKPPDWLKTRLILDQFGGEDRHKAYRQKVQRYSEEDGSVWEDVKHGLVYGSQDFVDHLKERFLSDKKNVELPQHNSMLGEFQAEAILHRAAQILNFDLESIGRPKQMTSEQREKRDLMIYLLWETGRFTNLKIGELFGLTYSSISRRVSDVGICMTKGKMFRERYLQLKSQIKV